MSAETHEVPLDRLPPHYRVIGAPAFMSNLFRDIDRDVEARLKDGPFWSRYAGYHFNGKVWWDCERRQWACEVWQYHVRKDTIIADTTDALMQAVSDRYGAE